MNQQALLSLTPAELRLIMRKNEFSSHTSGIAPGYAQANLAILNKELAYDFLLFCKRNSQACPILDATEVGSPFLGNTAKESDIRTDLPKYRIYKNGELFDEVLDIKEEWTENMVAFLIGCSFTFEHELVRNGIHLKHLTDEYKDKVVPMYKTNIPCIETRHFGGPVVVSMRPIKNKDVVRAVQITSRFPNVHGAPVQIGDPEKIGIKDLMTPDFGEAIPIAEDEVPVFWACGVTPQAVAMERKPEVMITHSPGHMFITDIKEEKLSVF